MILPSHSWERGWFRLLSKRIVNSFVHLCMQFWKIISCNYFRVIYAYRYIVWIAFVKKSKKSDGCERFLVCGFTCIDSFVNTMNKYDHCIFSAHLLCVFVLAVYDSNNRLVSNRKTILFYLKSLKYYFNFQLIQKLFC